MEVFGTEGNREKCSNCKEELSEEDKKVGMPICVNCIKQIIAIARNNIRKDSANKYVNDVDNFTNFISSSSMLMKLDYIVVVQACFNIFMNTLKNIEKIDLSDREQILRDSKRFIDVEIENTEIEKDIKKKKDENNKELELSAKGIFDMLMNGVDINREYVDNNGNIDDTRNRKEIDKGDIKDSKNVDILKGSKRIKVN